MTGVKGVRRVETERHLAFSGPGLSDSTIVEVLAANALEFRRDGRPDRCGRAFLDGFPFRAQASISPS